MLFESSQRFMFSQVGGQRRHFRAKPKGVDPSLFSHYFSLLRLRLATGFSGRGGKAILQSRYSWFCESFEYLNK
jgi:hypothetical protein